MAAIPNSILDTTKKLLGIDADYEAFDIDIVMHINSTFATLEQLGVGPVDGFSIEDSSSLWTDFIPDDKRLNSVKSYVYLKVRQYFDPPTTSFALTSIEKMISELEFRLQTAAESDALAIKFPPTPVVDPDGDIFSDDEPFVPMYYTGG
jgi:hypothetical protein